MCIRDRYYRRVETQRQHRKLYNLHNAAFYINGVYLYILKEFCFLRDFFKRLYFTGLRDAVYTGNLYCCLSETEEYISSDDWCIYPFASTKTKHSSGIRSVSYTHLDVYKRQILKSVGL